MLLPTLGAWGLHQMKLNLLFYPVEDMEAAVTFFRDTIGLPLKFRDGDRYCALDAGGITLGLVAGEEQIVSEPAIAFRVDDIDATVRRLTASGATILRPIEAGPHELRAVLRTPGGTPLIVAAKTA